MEKNPLVLEVTDPQRDLTDPQRGPAGEPLRTLPSAHAAKVDTHRAGSALDLELERVRPGPEPMGDTTALMRGATSDHMVAVEPVPVTPYGVPVAPEPVAEPFRPSPAMLALGGELVEWSGALVRVRYPAHDGWTDDYGLLSSGFISAMFEPVIAAVVRASAQQRQHSVLETSTRFFRAIRGGHVVIDGSLLRTGRTTATIECIAWDSNGELCAKGSATVLYVG